MICDLVNLPGGGTAIVCSRGRRETKPCAFCGKPATRLCDAEVAEGLGEVVHVAGVKKRLCSAALCSKCTRKKGPEDFCPLHFAADDPKAEVGSFDRGIDRSNPVTHEQRHGGDPSALFGQLGPDGTRVGNPAPAKLPAPPIEKCRTPECSAPIRWAKMLRTGNINPVDVEPVPNGNLVLSLRRGELVAEAFDPEKHAGRNRYVSHFATCTRGAEWRRREPTQRDLDLTLKNDMQTEARKSRGPAR